MTTRTLQILLALVDGPLHGYGIRAVVKERTEGAVVLRSGTLYEAVDRLQRQGWIEEVAAPTETTPSGGPPRRYYGLMPAGREALKDELARMDSVVRFARGRDLIENA